MTERVLNFHLGDNASHSFPDSVYIGTTAALPIRIINLAPAPEPVQLIVRTSSLETLSPLQAHVVTLDGFEIGRLADTGAGGDAEVHTVLVPRSLIREDQPQRLAVDVVGRLPSLEDDFVLRSLELTGADLVLGWV